MALTLSMHPGDDFFLNDERCVVGRIYLSEGFQLTGPDGRVHEIDAKKAVEIAPGVLVSDGHRLIVGKARVVIQAPKSIKIATGQNYRAAQERRPPADDGMGHAVLA